MSFLGIGLARRLLYPNMKGMSLEITEELIARQTPEAQAIIRVLLTLFCPFAWAKSVEEFAPRQHPIAERPSCSPCSVG
jgi:hypothetical protein